MSAEAAKKSLISIVIPAFNESENLPILRDRLLKVVSGLPEYDFEFWLIDNCSQDRTQNVAQSFVKQDPRWQYVRFSRNFGFEASLAAGLQFAQGDALIYLVSDLQDPPEKIPEMLEIWESTQADVVYGILKERNDSSWLKTLGAKIAYQMIAKLAEADIPANATDFRLISRRVIEVLKGFGERVRYLRGLTHWSGFRQVSFTYDREERRRGKSNASVLYCLGFAWMAMTSFSVKPLRWIGMIGVAVVAVSFSLVGLYTFFWALLLLGMSEFTPPPPGWFTLIAAVLFFGGLNCFLIGVLGEYIGGIFYEAKQRPIWIVERHEGTRKNIPVTYQKPHFPTLTDATI